MKTTKSIKRIKENITIVEFKKIMAATRGDDSIRENTRLNLLRTFVMLYHTGMRLNELQDLRVQDIKELLENETVKVLSKKTSSERKLYLTKEFKKNLTPLFDFEIEDDENRVICKGSNKNKRTGINPITFIQQVNQYLKVLGSGYTSHSFRQGILSDFGAKGVNIKIMSKFIGHSDIKTTLKYVQPSDEDIMMNLIR
ncbi:tyrosine-type recombinase/integrase [Candidatus Sulfurimonas baltica]|uniref:Site-specific integrase n=1 Tax=Candidatus Sulfurimonas baltica TaxID=2740404 RepID=A0A7S7RLV5_9BACT|nr:site-specific integrase [Candidatus Sulfurimonas baltica]QOY50924.1 site-specific integrase [Candidatus Sulfurimonas baltica]QOY53022.1 site-specific integrase [Candidatus Sulfurimonas baltica]